MPVAVTFVGVLGLSDESTSRFGLALLMASLVGLCHRVVEHHATKASFLPLVRTLYRTLGPALALLTLLFVKAVASVKGLTPLECVAICVAASLTAALSRVSGLGDPAPARLRIVVAGSAATAAELAGELRAREHGPLGVHAEVVGHVEAARDRVPADARSAALGRFEDLGEVVDAHRVDLLLLSNDAPRAEFFAEAVAMSPARDVRVMELASFYEESFGHVPLTAIDAAWFQWMLHPRYSSATSAPTRMLDLAVASSCLLVSAPLLAVLAVLVRRDGGPALYRQLRIGQGGETFELLKLRSMSVGAPDAAPRWSSAEDDRVTRLGRFLRRTHLDELPQLLNVLRGEMSIVGPRPEQPSFARRLESRVPFYTRRHRVRPGITGWAQVQCGYAGSDAGSAWKLCHDLYYLKHRSVGFDLLILAETVRTLVWDRQFDPGRRIPALVHRPASGEAVGEHGDWIAPGRLADAVTRGA